MKLANGEKLTVTRSTYREGEPVSDIGDISLDDLGCPESQTGMSCVLESREHL